MPSHEALESAGFMLGLLLFIPLIHRLFLRFFLAFSSLSLRVKDSQLAAFVKYMR